MTYIIAEAGVNHNGNEELAFELIKAAKSSGADCIKFQTFKASNLASESAQQAEYQRVNTSRCESQLSMLSRLELSEEAHYRLADYCKSVDIEFLSSAFDIDSFRFLAGELNLEKLKISSGELTNAPLILEHARSGCDLILSTGMSSLSEVEEALGVIAYGLIGGKDETPSKANFDKSLSSIEGQKALQDRVTLLHCTSEYPAPNNEINLKAMDTLASAFGLQVGYSDHSEGIVIPVAAAARGAVLIEKHFTLSKEYEGPDHKASLEPQEFRTMVEAIRQVEVALGSGIKMPTISEEKNKLVARKSILASSLIRKGEVLTQQNLAIKRPGTGVSPSRFWEILGKKATRDYHKGDMIIE